MSLIRRTSALLTMATVIFYCGTLHAGAAKLELKVNDRIAFIGNTFCERINQAGYFEAALTARFPDLKLSFRNLGFSADEVTRGTLGTGAGPGTIGPLESNVALQLRSLNFGDIHSHLHLQKADVIIACYGMMESFEGVDGLPKFEADLTSYLKMHLSMNYSGKGNPRIVLVSPIAHEKIDADVPDPASHNQQLEAYTESMRKVAAALNLPFIDLFHKTAALMSDKLGSPLTINGIHLNEYGNWCAAQIMMAELGFAPEPRIELDAAAGTAKATGFKVGAVEHTAERITVGLTEEGLPPATPPEGAQTHKSLLQNLPFVSIQGLAAGDYKLRVDGREVAQADAEAWKKGMRMPSWPGAETALRVRKIVDEKNWQFFMRYRAANGEYIYGRRKDPFGTKSFPPEFELIEKLVVEQEALIWQNTTPTTQTIELIRAK